MGIASELQRSFQSFTSYDWCSLKKHVCCIFPPKFLCDVHRPILQVNMDLYTLIVSKDILNFHISKDSTDLSETERIQLPSTSDRKDMCFRMLGKKGLKCLTRIELSYMLKKRCLALGDV